MRRGHEPPSSDQQKHNNLFSGSTCMIIQLQFVFGPPSHVSVTPQFWNSLISYVIVSSIEKACPRRLPLQRQ
jgi:hypothetical protein